MLCANVMAFEERRHILNWIDYQRTLNHDNYTWNDLRKRFKIVKNVMLW